MKIVKPKLPLHFTEGIGIIEAIRSSVDDGEDLTGYRFFKDEEDSISIDGMEIQESVFCDCCLSKCIFDRVVFVNTVFEKCDLSNVRFDNCGFHNVEFKGCKMMGTMLPESSFNNVLIEDCICRYLNMSFSKLKAVVFSNNDMTGSDLNGCSIRMTELTGCDMKESELSDVKLKGMDLRSDDISGIKLKGPELEGAVVNTMQAVELSRLLGIVIKD